MRVPFGAALLLIASVFCAGFPLRVPAAVMTGPSLLDAQGDPNSTPKAEPSDAQSTVVVFNSAEPDSGGLARFYAEKRSIPKDHVVGLPCSLTEEITREEYEGQIAKPLRELFVANRWWTMHPPSEGAPTSLTAPGVVASSRIRYVVLMRGIPLKIAAAADYPGDKQTQPAPVGQDNKASVESELSLLGAGGHPISGVIMNPYFRSFARFADLHRPEMLLVCRLDAATPETVRRMITDSLAAEQKGLRGFAYVDARGVTEGPMLEGDEWMLNIAENARHHGIPVILDKGPGLFPDAYPMRFPAFYFGWYAPGVAGPFTQPDFRFEPGAVAVHLHSFSATSLRDAHGGWCAPLLAAGAAATMGNVYEPYLDFTPHLDVFFDRLRSGFNFAESAYMCERVLSWMTTFLGDPLYRPFPTLEMAGKAAPGDEWSAFRAGALKWYESRPAGDAALKQAGTKLHSGVIFEGLGLLDLSVDATAEAIASFETARKLYKNPEDNVRVAIHELGALRAQGRAAEATDLVKKESQAFPGARGLAVLKLLDPASEPGKPK